ncbi:MAG: YdcF family protein [Pseudanabaenales cyanobacterium]|nr:YdcF family protein [Pseudanabaenales cyanobacterium]
MRNQRRPSALSRRIVSGLLFCSTHWSRRLRWGLAGAIVALAIWFLINWLTLKLASTAPVDAYLVLGGSIRREIYVAQQIAYSPQTSVLISSGSQAPCIRIVFEREAAPINQVWLEKCADSTFDNFFFGLPILRQWGVRKVRLVTSPSHLPRAQWMAQIILGTHGIWVEPDIVEEKGVPGNQETSLKTTLDVTRSLFWALISQIYTPKCSEVAHLPEVDLEVWRQQGFKCEHQAGID